MSESEQMGQCRKEVDDRYGSPCELKIADALDRLAADVAAIKEAVCDGSVAEERDRFFAGWAAALNERDKLRAEIEKLKAMLEQQPSAAPQPVAPPAGWLTDDERKVIIWAASELSAIGHHRPPDKEQCLRLSEDLRRLVKRHDAGSPPVVEVPPMQSWEYTAHEEALAYRAAMDRAGVAWKEVGRE